MGGVATVAVATEAAAIAVAGMAAAEMVAGAMVAPPPTFHEIILDAPPLSVNIIPNLPQCDDNYGHERKCVGRTLVCTVDFDLSRRNGHV